MRPNWITMTIGIVIGSAARVDGLVTSKTNIVNSPEPDFDIYYSTDSESIRSYYENAYLSGLIGLPGSEGEMIVCCRHFSYTTHGRKYTLYLTVYDGVIIDEETGKKLMVKHYPDEKTTRNALVRAMVHYMTSLGMMDVKPCELNYIYPLTSSDDNCTSHRSISCDQQCIFHCGEGYTVSTTEPITCCNRGQLSSSLPTCYATGGISTKASPSAAIVTSSSTVTPRATPPDHVDNTYSKASGLSNLTQTPTNTTNTHTDRVGTDIPEYSSRKNEKFLAILSLASVFIIIPLIYCTRKKRNNMMFSHFDDTSVSLISEGIDVEPDGRGSYKLWKVLPAEPSPTQLDSNENYRMNVRDKGLIYILNNKTFNLHDDVKLERKGSDIDVENVKHVFQQIGYKPVIYENLTAQGILQSLECFKGKIEPSHPSVVLMFMSHGDEKGILGVDLCHITVREIKNAFSGQKCKDLIGKPKIIFVQACRGDKTIKNVLESDWTPESRQCSNLVESRSVLENDGPEPQDLELRTRNMIEPDSAEADIAHYYIAQSTTEGHFSLRSRVEGSCFIQALCEELIKKAHEETLDTIMGMVTRRVQSREWRFNGLKTLQVPQIIKQGIEKDIYLLPKYPN